MKRDRNVLPLHGKRENLNTKNPSNWMPSEVHAYVHIIKELTEKKGWKKSQIYTQGECLEHLEIKKYLVKTKPENIVGINEKFFYVIEAKNERKKIDLALKEAREDYADKINKSNKIRVNFVTGIAGNEKEGFISKSQYLKEGKWETIKENNIDITGLISLNQVNKILEKNNPNIEDVEITEEEFLICAENINEKLHENSINKDYRARFISAILLAMSDGHDIDVTQNTTVLINSINTRAELILKNHKKSDFAKFIKIDEPSNADNHVKVKNAIIYTYQELLGLNIRSAMKSGKDVLGKFYEVFLRYGNGAKDIGIVLTPRHITKFVAEALDIEANDLVLDPACGTGGFLVSAFDEVKRKTKNKAEFENFRLNGMYGVEEQDPIIALAIVNMIFRGDGKNNMVEGNCFRKWLNAKSEKKCVCAEYLTEEEKIDAEKNKTYTPPITKVMMNPPFAKPNSEDKEYKFIEHALKQMQEGGLLFAVLPISVMIEKSGKSWRENLLRNNTLISVITFPEDLFYPTGVHTLGIFVKKGIAHNEDQKVLWIRALKDGFLKKKGKRLESVRAENDFIKIAPILKEFVKNQETAIKNIPEFQKASVIDFSDDGLELVPEAYLDDKIPSQKDIEDNMERLMRETVSFLIKNKEKI